MGFPRAPLHRGTGPAPPRRAISEVCEGLKSPPWDQHGRESTLATAEAFHGRANQICAQEVLGTFPSELLTKVKLTCRKKGPPQGLANHLSFTCFAQSSVGFTEQYIDLLERLDLYMKRCRAAPRKCQVKHRNWRHQVPRAGRDVREDLGKVSLSWTRKIKIGLRAEAVGKGRHSF